MTRLYRQYTVFVETVHFSNTFWTQGKKTKYFLCMYTICIWFFYQWKKSIRFFYLFLRVVFCRCIFIYCLYGRFTYTYLNFLLTLMRHYVFNVSTNYFLKMKPYVIFLWKRYQVLVDPVLVPRHAVPADFVILGSTSHGAQAREDLKHLRVWVRIVGPGD